MSDQLNETDNPIEEKTQEQVVEKPARPKTEPVSAEHVEEAVEVLYDDGGFDLIGTTLEDAENMEIGPMRDVFLSDQSPQTQKQREALKLRVQFWLDLLSNETNVGNMIEKCTQTADTAKTLLNANLKKTFQRTRKLEQNYRSVASFFVNAGGTKPVKNLTILNAPLDKVTDMDGRRFIQAVSDEFKEKYDRLDLMNNYSMLVVPGYLGSKTIVDEWARVACDHKVMMLTDFMDLENTNQVMRLFENSKMTCADEFRANVIMTCNWLAAREQYKEDGEDSPLFLPPSTALAGKMYSGNMAQVSAGVQHGVLGGIPGVRFTIHANDMAKLGDMGLVPMVYEYGQVQAMAKSTLFNGNNLGMQTYSVVRTFDWLTKVLMDYLNRKVFTNISVNEEMAINKEISGFMDKCVREFKFLEKFGKVEVKRDATQRDKVHVYIHATPYFPAKNFVLRLDGKSGELEGTGNQYNAAVEG